MKKIALLLLFVSHSLIAQIEPVNVVDLNFRIPAMTEHVLMYGFAEGDKINISYSEERSKKLKSLEILEYNASNIVSDFNVMDFNKELTIKNTGIYIFRFVNSSLARRICNLKIDRIPASKDLIGFNTTVKSKTIADTTYTISQETFVKSENYKVKEIASNQSFYINSGSNATFKSGKSRITLPISLPENTVKWYYTISSSRDEAVVNQVLEQMDLVSDVSKLLDQSGTIDFAIDLLKQPPGTDYCDVYLIDHDNYNLFLSKSNYSFNTIGTRENIVSANVEIPFSSSEILYLGIRNPDDFYGINVVVNVAAIVLEQELDTREIKTPHISYRTEYYID